MMTDEQASQSKPQKKEDTPLTPFVIDRKYAEDLRRKIEVFQRVTGTRKNVLLTMVTTRGLKDNTYAEELVAEANSLTLEDLF